MQNDVQQGAVNFQVAVVFNEAQFPEFIHEVTDARPRGADHLREGLLADLRNYLLRSAVLAKIRQEEKSSCQTPLARIEQMTKQFLLDEQGPSQKMPDEHLGKRWLLVEDANYGDLLQPHDLAFCHRHGCRDAPRLPGQASFAAEFVRP